MLHEGHPDQLVEFTPPVVPYLDEDDPFFPSEVITSSIRVFLDDVQR